MGVGGEAVARHVVAPIVVDAPCGMDGALTALDIERAFADADFRPGDAVLVRTGWGDGERWVELGDDYARRTPYFSKEAAEKLVELCHRIPG